jgi:hypothetical protein
VCNIATLKEHFNKKNQRVLASFFFLAFAHLVCTALRAIALRSSGVSFAALDFPPFEPPILPKATACGFFFLPIPTIKYVVLA